MTESDLFADQVPPKVTIPCGACGLEFDGDDEASVLAEIAKDHDCAGWAAFRDEQRRRFAALDWSGVPERSIAARVDARPPVD